MIITIARECGCNGDKVGAMLAEHYGILFIDKKALVTKAKEAGVYEKTPNFFAENHVNSYLYAIACGEGSTEVLKVPVKALKNTIGENSFVLIGRCGNYAFKEQENAVRIYLCGDKEKRIGNIMEAHHIDGKKARELVDETDEKRASFQKYYTGEEWGKACNYDLCVDVCKIGRAHV